MMAYRISCAVQAESWKFGEPYLGAQVAEGHEKSLGEKHELSLHAIILSWQVYYIESELWRHMAQKNQKIAQSPHILGRLNACTNSVYQVLLRFSRAGDEATTVQIW